MRRALTVLTGSLLAAAAAWRAPASAAGGGVTEEPAPSAVDFARDVRPLLAEKCLRCHGMDEQEGEVRLDRSEEVFRDRDGWAVVTPGAPEQSELWFRVAEAGEDERMPPAEAGPPLTAAQKELLRRWIAEGAAWTEHWAFAAPRVATPPAVRDAAWPLQALDRFLLARMEAEGVAPAPDADRATWLRRASFFLTGLPPTPEELDAFLADDAPGAHERVADRLLASPHYGEKWARHWLDLARYAETRGHEFDFRIPNAWQYRDWVVRAFNADLPYDRFVQEQIAGDLLEPPRLDPATGANESVIGTGFWWLGEEVHSPVDLRQDQADRTANKVDVFGKTFLGLTFACARCHDHKFDPIPAADFYALAGMIQSTAYRDARVDGMEREREVRATLATLESELGDAALRDFARRAEPALARAARMRAEAAAIRAETSQADTMLTFADFEGGSWDGWTATGDAFGARPAQHEDRAEYQAETVPAGAGFVHSHIGASGRSDDFTGELESPEFEIRHDELRFLVCGGNQPGRACVNLVVDGEVVLSETGRDANAFSERTWDLRRWHGRRARIRVVDRVQGSWGSIGVDDFVLRSSWSGIVDRRAADPEHAALLRAWGIQLEQPPPVLRVDLPAGARVHEDWTAADPAPLLQDGAVWLHRRAGEALHGVDPVRPVLGMLDLGAAVADPLFRGLRAAPESEHEATRLRWQPAGRTLRTRRTTLTEGVLWYLVSGRGVAFASVGGHRMLEGPLHGATALDLEAADGWRWIRHDLSAYTGIAAHVEFTPRGGGGEHPDEPPQLAVAMVVECAEPPALVLRESWEEFELAWAAAHPELLGPLAGEPSAAAAALLRGRAAALARRVLTSRLAPAAWEGSGADESVYRRGDPAQPGARAPRAAPELIRASGGGVAAMPAGAAESGRLALARAVAAADNPLTARVWVNRAWQHLFGRGLAQDPDNFGLLGRPPSHPELLDWLADRFVRVHGWRSKPMLRELVLSRAFRAGSTPLPAAAERDPANLLFHHFTPRRVAAEDLRDAVLAASGRLDRTLGGPPVPVFLTDFLQGKGRPSTSGPADGANRRTLYLEVRRNFLNPLLLAFDFPTPFTTIGRRSASNVPAQALALMNEPLLQQIASSWSDRLYWEPSSPRGRLERAFKAAFGRPPSAQDLARCEAFLADGGLLQDLLHAFFQAKEFQYVF
jgi:cytochrome c553